jgi:hypothetical protein
MMFCLSQSPQRKTEGWKRQKAGGLEAEDRRQKTGDRRRLEGWKVG